MKLEQEFEVLRLENAALTMRVAKLEGAQNVLEKRILSALNAPLAISRPESSRSDTFLGCRNDEGDEMHCANAHCPHEEKCRGGCIDRKSVKA